MAGTLPPTLRRLRPAWLAIAAGCLLGLAACDGYPSEDQPLVDVFSLNSVERLQRLNQLGHSASAVDRWRYSVAGDCELAVGMRSKGAGWEHRQIGLRKQNFKLAYSTDKASFDVRADAHADPQAGVHLFSGKDRGSALEVTLLVKLLARDCQAGAEDPGIETI